MKILLFSLLLASASPNLTAQPPVIHTYAFSRSTIPGIKGEPGRGDSARTQNRNPFPIRYQLYFTVPKGTDISISGVWFRGKYYAASLEKVNTPVLSGSDGVNTNPNPKDTLVKATTDDTYAIQLGQGQTWAPRNDMETNLTQENQLVIFLKSGDSVRYGLSKEIKPLRPYRAM